MYQYKVKLDRVIDGDTIDCYIDLGFDINTKKRIRFVGINTPESRTRDLEEKVKGLAAKARLKEILETAGEIHLDSHGLGKYGRVLGELYVSSYDEKDSPTMINVNELLIKEGHAVEYHGGKR
jgi:micrococcal nuclease